MSEATPSRQTLEEVPRRVLTFVMAASESSSIRAALASQGYNQKEHDLAWSLLRKISSYSVAGTPAFDMAVRAATDELDAWDEPHFGRMQATLDRLHPEQSRFVFEGLAPKQGVESVMSVSTLLDRLDALESAPERLETRDADHAALATLEGRGYSPAERARLRGLVHTAQHLGASPPLSSSERTQVLLELYGWLTDWSTTARTVIARRDQLIRLGIAKRRRRTKAETTPAPAGSDAH